MSTLDEETQLMPALGNGHEPSSVFDVLRAKRAEHSVDSTFDVEVPGYQSLLVLRLGPIPGATLSALRARMEKSRAAERDFNLNADYLIAACRDVLTRKTQDEQLAPPDEDEPMRLDVRLAEALGLTATSAREVVRQLYGAAPSPELAVQVAVGRYLEWAAAMDVEDDETFMGESPAASR
jgi:hypothetical protein